MPSRVAALCCCAALVLITVARPAQAWIENHVLGDEVRIEVDAAGKALVEHRFTVKTTGSERLRTYRIRGVDRDAVPAPNSYVIPARDALSNSLDSATPLTLRVRLPQPGRTRTATTDTESSDSAESEPAVLELVVDGDRGLRRGTYVFVVRYRTDLRARGLLDREGSMVQVRWTGPAWDDGFDNARALFVVPAAPTPPRALDALGMDDEGEGAMAPRYLSEVRRGQDVDEVELLRSYAPTGERIAWGIRVDQRALEPLPARLPVAAPAPPARGAPLVRDPVERSWLLGSAALLFLVYTLLVLIKARQVARLARRAGATVPPWIPLPVTLRAVCAGVALVAGVWLQLLADHPFEGACLIVLATALAAHGAARVDFDAAMRGPGRWLSVGESEALGKPVRPAGASLDVSTRLGKALLLLCLAGVGGGAWALWTLWQAPLRAVLVGLDSVALLAVFGTGRLTSLPPDLAVEPIRFFRKLAARIRGMKAGRGLRIVPRLRIPAGGLDPDELRLLVVPRFPLRGFAGIEIGVTYALGFGARVAMPEVLLRATVGSPAEQAAGSLAAHGRWGRGRKPDERVVAFVPRLPTVRMTAEIVVALAARLSDHQAIRRGVGAGASTPPKPRTAQAAA